MPEPDHFNLTINNNLKLIDPLGRYNADQLASAVAYWHDFLNDNDCGDVVAINYHSGLTFTSIALLLAVINSNRSYIKFDLFTSSSDSVKNAEKHGVKIKYVFSAGETSRYEHPVNELKKVLVETDSVAVVSEHHLEKSINYDKCIYTINFPSNTTRSSFTSGTTGEPELISVDMLSEGMAIQRAMDSYFSGHDVCLFSHDLAHIGVHTSAVLPAVFKAKILILADQYLWGKYIDRATHTQFFSIMLNHPDYEIPSENRIKTVTTGGEKIKESMVKYLLSRNVDRIINIYGATEFPPPVAVCEIKSIDDINNPFDIIKDKNFSFYSSYTAFDVIVRNNNTTKLYSVGDYLDITPTKITFHRRTNDLAMIRYMGKYVSSEVFVTAFEEQTNIYKYFLDVSDSDRPKLYFLKTDFQAVDKFLVDNAVYVEIIPVDSLDTSSGIKVKKPKQG